MSPRVAVIGGGWAGCAAALSLAEAGVHTTLFEAGNILGGRARAVQVKGHNLDNGQHILLGAYDQTLNLIARVNPRNRDSTDAILLRLPLALDRPPDFSLVCPRLPAPFHLLVGLWRARGLGFFDKLAASRWVNSTLNGREDMADTSVAQLIANQPKKVRAALWEPLCIAALNTRPEQASAKAFKQVLAASFGKLRNHSDLLFPRVDLTCLFPAAASKRIIELKGEIRLQTRIKTLRADSHKIVLATLDSRIDFDRVIVAVAPQHVAGICAEIAELKNICRIVESYRYEVIATVYLQYSQDLRLPRPMLSLSGGPAQFVFDRGHTHGQPGLLAFVISAASSLLGHPQSEWVLQIQQQFSRIVASSAPLWIKAIVEKQATYLCSPNIAKPENHTPHPLIFIAGDYTTGPYPATLESATRSGVKSAQTLLNSL